MRDCDTEILRSRGNNRCWTSDTELRQLTLSDLAINRAFRTVCNRTRRATVSGSRGYPILLLLFARAAHGLIATRFQVCVPADAIYRAVMGVAVYLSFITRIASTVVTEPVSPASFRDDLVRLRLFPTAARHRTRARITPTITRRTRVGVARWKGESQPVTETDIYRSRCFCLLMPIRTALVADAFRPRVAIPLILVIQ